MRSGPGGTGGVVAAVSVTHAVTGEGAGATGIDKREVAVITVTEGGVDGDTVVDRRVHGGPDKAVYAYAGEDADVWAAELGRDVPPGWFGDNLRLRDVEVSHAVIGERWRVGADVLLEVTQPRTPCVKFQRHVGEEHWVRRFAQAGRPGAYLRVLSGGPVRSGDAVVVEHRPDHGVTAARWITEQDPADARRLLDARQREGLVLAPSLLAHLERALARA